MKASGNYREGRVACLLLAALVVALVARPTRAAADTDDLYTQTIPGTLVRFEMVRVPGGEIEISDPANPGTPKKVTVKSFWIGKREVTWDEYDVFVYRLDEPEPPVPGEPPKDGIARPSRPYGAADRGFGHKGYPVINVSFVGARQFCKWLSKKTGRTYRLPTEAEWELACRAGCPAPGPEDLVECAWYGREKTSPVGGRKPNAWGIHDMLGNVAEWCTDLAGKPVVCGGSFEDRAEKITPCARQYQDDSWRATDCQNPKSAWWLSDGPFVGFRVISPESNSGDQEEEADD